MSSKFELNILNNNTIPNLPLITTFIIKNKIPYIVVKPEMSTAAMVERSSKNGRFKIIVAIGFDDFGKSFATDKLINIHKDSFAADGFDILITPNKTQNETKNEMISIIDFISKINTLSEIRFSLHINNDCTGAVKAMNNLPISMIRGCQHVELSDNVISKQILLDRVINIRKLTGKSIKIGGNINYEIYKELLKYVTRFDVTYEQARSILRAMELENNKK